MSLAVSGVKGWGELYVSTLPNILNSAQDNLPLDMYLAPHVRTLYTQIRNRALIQVIAILIIALLLS